MARSDNPYGLPRLNDKGAEVPDPVPIELPAGFSIPETIAQSIQRLVRGAVSRAAHEQGLETFEESEDFDMDEEEDDDKTSPYETHFDPVLGKDISPREFRDAEAHYRRQYLEAQRRYFASIDRNEVVQRAHRPAASEASAYKVPGTKPSPEGSSTPPGNARQPSMPSNDGKAKQD